LTGKNNMEILHKIKKTARIYYLGLGVKI
jgi:hypothetical protein